MGKTETLTTEFPIMTDEEGAVSGTSGLEYAVQDGGAYLRRSDQEKWLRVTSSKKWDSLDQLTKAIRSHEPKRAPNGNVHPYEP